ncbi:ArsR/SmtB family transcription factor [Halovivax gelatinilyticus]|uniref:ArsR/SmtB family transcription factor n=1 Tax=Halovivax gelatinilyticus TaxID=2961597 RepID=UPI0020CA7708|nr:helix-turn-helix domain-containing protein [Halovivax gelatinilyticus]
MGRLLPTRTEVTIDRDDEPRLLCLDDEETGDVLGRLASDTGREIVQTIYAEPMSAQDLASTLDRSVQSVSYHLEKLEAVGIIEVLDTCYSEKGQEMAIYGPPSEPLVVYVGMSDDQRGLRAAFERFAGAIGPVAILIAIGETLSRLLGGEE